jgi:hypothetical protein
MLPRHWPSRSSLTRAASPLISAAKASAALGEIIGEASSTYPITGFAVALALACRDPRTTRTKPANPDLRILGITPDVATGLATYVAWRRVSAGLVREHTFQPMLGPQACVDDVHRRCAIQVPSLSQDRRQGAAHRAGLMA